MKQFSRIYVEITNVCNLSCSFCLGNTRAPRFLSTEEFAQILTQIKPYTSYICLHVLGEPLLHPLLAEFLEIASQLQFKINITTNGTLLAQCQEILLHSPALRKVSISLHSLETPDLSVRKDYLDTVAEFAERAAAHNILCELRLWNLGVDEIDNQALFIPLCERLKLSPETIEKMRVNIEKTGGVTLKPNLFLGKSPRFTWPSLDAPYTNQPVFCHGLRNQVAILSDGTVVPCCLDSHGDIPLGNLFTQSFSEIMIGQRARAIYDGFSQRKPVEELCKRCGYATRF